MGRVVKEEKEIARKRIRKKEGDMRKKKYEWKMASRRAEWGMERWMKVNYRGIKRREMNGFTTSKTMPQFCYLSD